MKKSKSTVDLACTSIRVQHVHDKLAECKQEIDRTLLEIERKFPKSLFEHIEGSTDGINESAHTLESCLVEDDDRSASEPDKQSEGLPDSSGGVLDRSVPNSPGIGNSLDSLPDDSSEKSPETYHTPPSSPPPGKHSIIKHEVMKLFKITTGAGHHESSAQRKEEHSIPLVTSIPPTRKHSLLLLFQLEVPKVLGTVTRMGVNQDGLIAGGTVHGEIFLYNKLPYSRSPSSITRGHDGGVISVTWMAVREFVDFFITTGLDKKILLWQSMEGSGIDGPHVELKLPSVPTCCCIHPVNQDIVIFGFLDHSVNMYRIERSKSSDDGLVRLVSLGISTNFNKPVTAVSVSPDGKKLSVGSSVGTIGLIDLSTMSLDVEVDCKNRSGATSSGRKIVGLNWSQDSTCVLVSSCDSRLRVVLVSDLSRRTKFKSPQYVNENLFLTSMFGPPDDERIIAVSENGNVCIWELHTGSDTNEKCATCNMLETRSKMNPKKAENILPEITASVLVAANEKYCTAVQEKYVNLGAAFSHSSGFFVVTCDTTGCIRVIAELFSPGGGS
jgi:WD40 repeat protein